MYCIQHNLHFHRKICSSPEQIDARFQQFKNTLYSNKMIHTWPNLDDPELRTEIHAHKCDLTRQIFL